MMRRSLSFLCFFCTLAFYNCSERNLSATITLVDIGELGRVGIGQELQVINQHHPKVVAFNFILDHDSLSRDSLLVLEMSRNKNIVTCVEVGNQIEGLGIWRKIVGSHSKFETEKVGFSNFNMTEPDSVFIPELPMRQITVNGRIPAFSYSIADAAFGLKEKYEGSGLGDHEFNKKRFGSFFKVISPEDLLSNRFDPNDIKDKVVIMGYVSTEALFYLNKKRTKYITGTEIQACFVREIMKED